MGPSGCGKSTVGRALAESIGARFVDGDDLHPLTSVEKMTAGIPLDDADREPWLRVVGATLRDDERIVVACSALRRAYRDLIRAEAPDAYFVELVADPDTLAERLRVRAEHFMPGSLLASQLEALESLEADERGIRVPAVGEPAAAVRAVRDAVSGGER